MLIQCNICLDAHTLFSSLHSFSEIGQRSSEELAREASGVKAFSSFIAELGSLVPELMIPNISVLITHLEGEVHVHPANIESFIYSSPFSGLSCACTVMITRCQLNAMCLTDIMT